MTRHRFYCLSSFFLLALLLCSPGWSQTPATHYAVFLTDEPLATHFSSRAEMQSATGVAWRARIEAAQGAVRNELAARNIRITGSAGTLLNAIFVVASPARLAEIKAIPGVVDVVKLGRSKMLLNRAIQILDGPQAWNLLGGMSSAGAGIKIGILDTGIDQTHPSLQDSSLQTPAGFPKCNVPSDCTNFTNSKVIVARSYVALNAAGSDPNNPAADSTPDDYSARDHVGHGTAVATSAAGNTATLAVTINGMAPKAWVGSYKISGSPGVNDGSSNDALIQAIEDAVNDGMDVVTTSFGGTSFTGPVDTGTVCGNAAGVPCDPVAYAFEQAAAKGVIVLAAAGNEGEGGTYGTGTYPQYNTISSPADAPSVIAVGAVSDTHGFNPDVEVAGSGVPSNLNSISASFTDAFSPYGAYSAPLVDLAQIGDSTGLGCNALPPFSLLGAFALIERGTCNFSVKMTNAVNAGALGAIIYDNVNETSENFGGLSSFSQPVLAIGMSDGQNLKAFIDSHPGHTATINPSATEVAISGPVVLAGYSSFGPGLGTSGIKPDVLAVGGGSGNGDLIYMGAQNYDPLGEVFSSVRYIAAAGTSFATPLTAGSAALVKQQHPGYTGQQVKSAIVNTASQSVTTDDGGFSGIAAPLNILQSGSGLVAADLAIQTNVTVVPSTVSFGSFPSASPLSQSQPLTITNTGSSSVNLSFANAPISSASGITISVSPSSLALGPGQAGTLTVSLAGSISAGGLYYGSITISGASVPMRIPYMVLSPTSGTVNLDAVSGDEDEALAGQIIPDGQVAFQLTDANGVPVTGAAVTFSQARGSVPLTISEASTTTDNYGFAYATVTIGSQTGNYVVNATGGGQSYQFSGSVSPPPTVSAGGVVNAANSTSPVAPGSYVSIYGSNLSYITDQNYSAVRLPLSMDQVTVSFDAAATGSLPAVSVPGHMVYVSPSQVNIQVPWELQGYSSAKMKVTLFEFGFGNVVTVPIANYTPAMFGSSIAAAENATTGQIITAANPAARGSVVSLFCNGLGPVTNQPASGDSAGVPLSTTTTQATVTIGGTSASVSFSGLAPGFPGLYQVNAQVPSSIQAGNQPVIVSIGGVSSPALTLPVQ
ncbi:MAG TPA: S8 family serine peptidase [Bryobacteraceae bacterium]|nr:S8 family serine peptidase [Bryobacteraceae bacterium]